ncbi:hypothetical protein D3C83_147780 [compost metagenome]
MPTDASPIAWPACHIENDTREIIGESVVIHAVPAFMMIIGFLPSVASGADAIASGE